MIQSLNKIIKNTLGKSFSPKALSDGSELHRLINSLKTTVNIKHISINI